MHVPETTKPAAQYLRVSTDFQKYSIENQSAAIALYAKEAGFGLVQTYCDEGRSGLSTKGRDGLKSLLADVLSGDAQFDVVLVLDVSRWGRYQDPDEAAHYEFLCRSAGIEVIYCAEVFGSDATGSIFKQLKRVMAGEYCRELSTKVRRGKWRQANRGRALGGVVPFGFRRCVLNADGTLGSVLHEGERKSRLDQEVVYIPGPATEVRTLRTIFRLFVHERMSPASIAEYLNARQQPWKSGHAWNKGRVHKALNCALAMGDQEFNKTRVTLGHREELSRELWVRRTVTKSVVSRAMFAAARRRADELGGRRRRTDAEMDDDLRWVVAKYGRATDTILASNPRSLGASAYRERFGSLSAAYARIGYANGWRQRVRNGANQAATRSEIVAGLQRINCERGRINYALIEKDHRLPSRTYIERQFGSMRAAVEAAGLSAARQPPGPR